MKITKAVLKRIIKEEVKKALKENDDWDEDEYDWDEDEYIAQLGRNAELRNQADEEESDWDKISNPGIPPEMALMLAKVSPDAADILSRLKRRFNERLFNDRRWLQRQKDLLAEYIDDYRHPDPDRVAQYEAEIAKYQERVEQYESLMSQIPEEVEMYLGGDY